MAAIAGFNDSTIIAIECTTDNGVRVTDPDTGLHSGGADVPPGGTAVPDG